MITIITILKEIISLGVHTLLYCATLPPDQYFVIFNCQFIIFNFIVTLSSVHHDRARCPLTDLFKLSAECMYSEFSAKRVHCIQNVYLLTETLWTSRVISIVSSVELTSVQSVFCKLTVL